VKNDEGILDGMSSRDERVRPVTARFPRPQQKRCEKCGLEHVEHGLALAARHRFHPGYAIYEPGFMRAGARFARAIDTLPQPVYRLMFSDGFPFGFPPRPYAIDA